MTITAQSLRDLADLNLSSEQMAGVLRIIADMEDKEEAKRAATRERVRKHRALQSRYSNVTVTDHPPFVPPLDKENTPTPPKEINPPPISPPHSINARDDFSVSTENLSEASPPPKPSRAKPKTRLPDNFQPDKNGIRRARETGMTEPDIHREVQKFRDHHAAHGKAMSDWQAAWRTWVGNWKQFSRGHSPPRQNQISMTDMIDRHLGKNHEPDHNHPRQDYDLELTANR